MRSELIERLVGRAHPQVASTRNNLSLVRAELGDLQGAERELRQVLEIEQRPIGVRSRRKTNVPIV